MTKRSDEPPKGRDSDGLHKRRSRGHVPSASGVWHYSLTINGKRRFFSTRTSDYQEARRVRSKAEADQEAGRMPNDLSKARFEIVLAQVLEDRKPHLAENSIRIDRERSGPLLKHFSGRRVSTIDIAAIRAYQTARQKQVGNRTVNLETKLLRFVLKAAKKWTAIADDYKPLPEDRRGPGRAIEESQEKLLFDTAKSRPEWDAAFYAALVAANTTMRGVEIKNLHISDVNLIDGEVRVNRSKGNTAGVRGIELNAGAMWAFAKLLERANALGSIAPDHFLLPRALYRQTKAASRGTGYDPTRPQKTWRTAWRSLVREAARRAADGITDEAERKKAMAPFIGLRFHDLRHLAVTKLAESGASDSTVQSMAGHMSRAMMEHYSHIRRGAKRKAVDSIYSYVPEEIPATPTTKRVQ
jgi:integrase